ncbi:unnamed protein product [Pylaiella littoralis]
MRLALVLSLLATSIFGATGFMCPAAGSRVSSRSSSSRSSRNGGSRQGAGVSVVSASSLWKGQARTATAATRSRACTSSSGFLRMAAAEEEEEEVGVAADGGSTDGAALAEARIVVQGQSTGGYFRAQARNEAHFNRKLCGALKELGKGQTEIIVEGKTSAIRSFLRWCKKGPGLSQQIDAVTVDWSDYTGIFDGFEVFPDKTSQSSAAGVP